jgi:hypothetical protein
MAIDLRRTLLAAAEAALEDALGDSKPSNGKQRKQPHLKGGRALLLGAGLMTVGRLAVAARGSGALDSIRERLAEYEAVHLGRGGEEFDEDEPEAEWDEDFDDEEEPEADVEDEPEDEGEQDPGEEDPEAEVEDEPEDESDEPADDEPAPPRRRRRATSRSQS